VAAPALVADYLRWEVVVNSGESILDAIALEQRYGISFWMRSSCTQHAQAEPRSSTPRN